MITVTSDLLIGFSTLKFKTTFSFTEDEEHCVFFNLMI